MKFPPRVQRPGGSRWGRELDGVDFEFEEEVAAADVGVGDGLGVGGDAKFGLDAAVEGEVLDVLEVGDAAEEVVPVHAARGEDGMDDREGGPDLLLNITLMDGVTGGINAGRAGDLDDPVIVD